MFNNVIKHEDDDEAKPREKVENEDNKNESLKPRKINSWLLALVDDERREVFLRRSPIGFVVDGQWTAKQQNTKERREIQERNIKWVEWNHRGGSAERHDRFFSIISDFSQLRRLGSRLCRFFVLFYMIYFA